MDTQASEHPVRKWIEDSHLVSRTGAGAVVGGLGLATAVMPSAAVWGLAALLALAGAGVRFWSAGIISKNRKLATDGPYAYVRNPLYSGSLLIGLAFVLLNGNPWFGIPAIVGMVVIYMRTIDAEEQQLRELFGPDFDRFRDTVPALIPWKGRCDMDGDGEVTYSLSQSLFNKEYNGVFATLGMLALFYGYANWFAPVPFRVGGAGIVTALIVVRGIRRVALIRREPEPVQAESEPEPVQAESEPEPIQAESEPEPVQAESEPEPVQAESEPEPVQAESEPEPVQAESEPEPVQAESEPEASAAEEGYPETFQVEDLAVEDLNIEDLQDDALAAVVAAPEMVADPVEVAIPTGEDDRDAIAAHPGEGLDDDVVDEVLRAVDALREMDADGDDRKPEQDPVDSPR